MRFLNNAFKIFKVILYPLVYISGLIQNFLFTAQPTYLDIDMAVVAIHKLEELRVNMCYFIERSRKC